MNRPRKPSALETLIVARYDVDPVAAPALTVEWAAEILAELRRAVELLGEIGQLEGRPGECRDGARQCITAALRSLGHDPTPKPPRPRGRPKRDGPARYVRVHCPACALVVKRVSERAGDPCRVCGGKVQHRPRARPKSATARKESPKKSVAKR